VVTLPRAGSKDIDRLRFLMYTVVQKNAPTLADYNYDPVQSI